MPVVRRCLIRQHTQPHQLHDGMSLNGLPSRIAHSDPHLRAISAKHVLIVTVALILCPEGNNWQGHRHQQTSRKSQNPGAHDSAEQRHKTHPHPMLEA
jgi:hypothetical protein